MSDRLALQIPLNGEPIVGEVSNDPDAFDADDCSLYNPGPDADYIEMIEASLKETCECGNQIFCRNRCIGCGATAPWAEKLGCGLL